MLKHKRGILVATHLMVASSSYLLHRGAFAQLLPEGWLGYTSILAAAVIETGPSRAAAEILEAQLAVLKEGSETVEVERLTTMAVQVRLAKVQAIIGDCGASVRALDAAVQACRLGTEPRNCSSGALAKVRLGSADKGPFSETTFHCNESAK